MFMENFSKISFKPYYEQEAWIGILFASVSTSGKVYDSEIDALTKIFVYKSFFDDFDFMDIYQKVDTAQKEIGSKELVDLCIPLISENNKSTVYTNAVSIVYADGIVRNEQEELLAYIGNQLGLEKSKTDTINQVMSDLYRYNKEFTEDFIDSENLF